MGSDRIGAAASLRRLALAAGFMLAAEPALAAAPAPAPITPALIEAAKKEGKVVFYTSIDVQVIENLAKSFEAAYPGVSVQVERNGAERIFQRLAQERGSSIYAADVLESSDQTHFLAWKRQGWLEPFLPTEVAEKWPAAERDPDGCFASVRYTLSAMGYNTKQVKPEDAPKSYADLLDKKWSGKIVKAHPGYSGIIMTATFAISQALGWEYFEKLGKQRVMQLQSATEPPKKIALGERAIMADGSEYLVLQMKESGSPVDVIYPSEGTPIAIGGLAIAKNMPHPNAAKLFVSYFFSREGQQLMSDVAALRSFHPEVKLKAGRKPLSEIKILRSDPAEQEKAMETIKQKYAQYFGI
ncbi:MAG: extracellular solute-binding protein [Proteobacteria bacterium]|nr:extracellular solute-binding protein [Pseudomonadota bacterium]MBI3498306.1 extracellular solute-binding protein [Pseudomonadota bacterium]